MVSFYTKFDNKKIQNIYGDRIEIMVGSGVNSNNISMLKKETNVSNFHLSAKHSIDSDMTFRHPIVSMGGANINEYSKTIANYNEIKKVVQLVKN